MSIITIGTTILGAGLNLFSGRKARAEEANRIRTQAKQHKEYLAALQSIIDEEAQVNSGLTEIAYDIQKQNNNLNVDLSIAAHKATADSTRYMRDYLLQTGLSALELKEALESELLELNIESAIEGQEEELLKLDESDASIKALKKKLENKVQASINDGEDLETIKAEILSIANDAYLNNEITYDYASAVAINEGARLVDKMKVGLKEAEEKNRAELKRLELAKIASDAKIKSLENAVTSSTNALALDELKKKLDTERNEKILIAQRESFFAAEAIEHAKTLLSFEKARLSAQGEIFEFEKRAALEDLDMQKKMKALEHQRLENDLSGLITEHETGIAISEKRASLVGESSQLGISTLEHELGVEDQADRAAISAAQANVLVDVWGGADADINISSSSVYDIVIRGEFIKDKAISEASRANTEKWENFILENTTRAGDIKEKEHLADLKNVEGFNDVQIEFMQQYLNREREKGFLTNRVELLKKESEAYDKAFLTKAEKSLEEHSAQLGRYTEDAPKIAKKTAHVAGVDKENQNKAIEEYEKLLEYEQEEGGDANRL